MCRSISGTSCLLASDKWLQHFSTQKASLITIRPPSNHERGLLLVAGVHPDSVVAKESVHEAEELVARGGVYYEVDLR